MSKSLNTQPQIKSLFRLSVTICTQYYWFVSFLPFRFQLKGAYWNIVQRIISVVDSPKCLCPISEGKCKFGQSCQYIKDPSIHTPTNIHCLPPPRQVPLFVFLLIVTSVGWPSYQIVLPVENELFSIWGIGLIWEQHPHTLNYWDNTLHRSVSQSPPITKN